MGRDIDFLGSLVESPELALSRRGTELVISRSEEMC
jgi:hypothetical protein